MTNNISDNKKKTNNFEEGIKHDRPPYQYRKNTATVNK